VIPVSHAPQPATPATAVDRPHPRPQREARRAPPPPRDAGAVAARPPAPVDAGAAPPPPAPADAAPPARSEADVRLAKARVAFVRGDLDAALTELEAARGLRENAAVHAGFAEVYGRKGNRLRALWHWQRAVSLSPADAGIRVRFAETLAAAGETEDACNMVRSALALKPRHTRGLALMTRLECSMR
jgi:Flp pilus assembly protein TadD